MNRTEVINRINRILGDISCCQLEFQETHDVTGSEWNARDIDLLKTSQIEEDLRPRFITSLDGRMFAFPVRVQGKLIGLAIVKGWPSALPTELVAVADLLAAVLEHRLNHEASVTELREFESRMKIQEESQRPSNVTPIRPTRLSQVREMKQRLVEAEDSLASREETVTESKEKEAPESTQVSIPLLIESATDSMTQKVALELHERAGRWAFLSLEDLSPDALESRENLKALGGITLFIRNLAKLSIKQQIRLAEYLAIQPGADMPQVIAGIQAEDRNHVLPHLLDLFCATRAASRERLHEAIIGTRLIPFDLRLLDPDQAPVH